MKVVPDRAIRWKQAAAEKIGAAKAKLRARVRTDGAHRAAPAAALPSRDEVHALAQLQHARPAHHLSLSLADRIHLQELALRAYHLEGQLHAQVEDFAPGGRANRSPEASEEALYRVLHASDALDEIRGRIEAMRDQLPAAVQRKLDHFGRRNPDVAGNAGALSKEQRATLSHFLTRFQSPAALALGPGVLGPGVKPVSTRVLVALTGAMRSPYSSIDRVGAPNIDHLGSVMRGVFEQEAALVGGPLTQREADRLALNTVLTDAWMKGRGLEALSDVPLAATNAGATVAEAHEQLLRTAATRFDEGFTAQGAPGDAVRAVVHGWIDRSQMPMSEGAVREAAAAAGLEGPAADALVEAWQTQLMDTGLWSIIQGFNVGVMLHDLVSYEPVRHVVESAGEGFDPKEVHMAVLGHGHAGFVASGRGLGDLHPDYQAMEAELPRGGATPLADLETRATALAAHWRTEINRATARNEGLSPPQRLAFRKEAQALREAVAALPEDVRSQLINDDDLQYTPEAVGKWIEIGRGETIAATLQGVFASAQAYYEEALARDLEAPGSEFRRRIAPTAERLGFSFDEAKQVWRPARTGEVAFDRLAQGLASDPALVRAAQAQLGHVPSATERVEWFRAQPHDSAALLRLVQGA